MNIKRVFLRRTALSLTICMVAAFGPVNAQTAEEIAFARDYLDQLQARSFRSGREYCGFFGYDRKGKLVAVKPRPGDATSCVSYWPRGEIDVIASYHTHGSWDKYSDGEVPSVEDVTSDMEDDIDGYISTPGGRLWFVNGETGQSHQICGRECLSSDPNFKPEPAGSVPNQLTLKELRVRQSD